MGMTSRAHLYYGYALGGQDGWHIEEVADEFSAWHPAWIEPDLADIATEDGYTELVEQRLLEVVAGFTEVWTLDDDSYFDRRRDARERVGVELEGHGHYDYRQYVLTTYSKQVGGSTTCQLDFAELDRQRLAGNWDAALERAVQALGITPTQPRGWLIAASYG